MLEYEKPANQSEENIAKRCEIARGLYMDYLQTKYAEEEKEDSEAATPLEKIADTLDKINWNLATLTETLMEIKKKL